MPFTNTWDNFTNTYVDIFIDALNTLSDLENLQNKEIKISENLRSILQEECFRRNKAARLNTTDDLQKDLITPLCEVRTQEYDVKKKPDFSCVFANADAQCAEENELFLHIECKRIGEGDLDRRYVTEGFMRYFDNDYRYGANAKSGIMIGYKVSSDFATIQNNVNLALVHRRYSPVAFTNTGDTVIKYKNRYPRESFPPNQFTIHHIWCKVSIIQ